MSKTAKTKSARIRESLNHPIIDGDGHIIELGPVILDYLKQSAGPRVARRFEKIMTKDGGPWGWYAQSAKQRRDWHTMRPPFWVMPARNSLDRATTMLPNLMRERLDEFGIDFAVVYTSMGLPFVSYADEEIRQSVCRALNLMYADLFRDHQDRLTPAAVIPMHTPKEAMAETRFAVEELGFKTVMIAGTVKRPIAAVKRRAPKLADHAYWIDSLALDSDYDYDPLWETFIELGVAPATHNNSMGWGARATTSSYLYNHIGQFAAAGEAFAKALFLGGVTHRYPQLNFAFLEGGAAWGSNLYNDIVGHWEKRNSAAALRNLDPAGVDTKKLAALFRKHGGSLAKAAKGAALDPSYGGAGREDLRTHDEFAACGIKKAYDIKERFVANFYFGCEADDRQSSVAFNSKINCFGAKLKAMFSSDIGHWDVTDQAGVVAEAYELVEDGLLSKADFKAFTFGNIAELHSQMNPDFFKNTVVEREVRRHMRARNGHRKAA